MGGRSAQNAQELEAIASEEELPIAVVEIDVTDRGSVAAGVAEAQEVGPIEVLLNNAGIGVPGPAELHSDEWVQRQIDTNLMGYHRMARAVLRQMPDRGRGYIIQTSSGLGRILNPVLTWYVGTKHATEAVSELMAYELAPLGVDVTILQPGRFPTDFTDNAAIYFQELLADPQTTPALREVYAPHIGIAQDWTESEPPTDPGMVADTVGPTARGSRAGQSAAPRGGEPAP